MTKTMKIEGMMCGHCEAAVKKALEALEQVDTAEVSHEAGTAVVTLNSEISNEVLKKTVEDKDYIVTAIGLMSKEEVPCGNERFCRGPLRLILVYNLSITDCIFYFSIQFPSGKWRIRRLRSISLRSPFLIRIKQYKIS